DVVRRAAIEERSTGFGINSEVGHVVIWPFGIDHRPPAHIDRAPDRQCHDETDKHGPMPANMSPGAFRESQGILLPISSNFHGILRPFDTTSQKTGQV